MPGRDLEVRPPDAEQRQVGFVAPVGEEAEVGGVAGAGVAAVAGKEAGDGHHLHSLG
jgi:hypothetical protein